MSDQPKPTTGETASPTDTKSAQEWTAEMVEATLADRPFAASTIASHHNAALAASRAGGWLSQEALDEYAKVEQEHQQLLSQLTAEREEVARLRTALGQAHIEHERAEKQLAAERETRQLTEYNQIRWMRNCEKLEKQLAVFRKNWPKVHKAIRSDIMVAEAAEEIHALAALAKLGSHGSK